MQLTLMAREEACRHFAPDILSTHPLVANEEEKGDAEPGHDDEVYGAPLDDVHEEDAEHNYNEMADKAKAAREVELGEKQGKPESGHRNSAPEEGVGVEGTRTESDHNLPIEGC